MRLSTILILYLAQGIPIGLLEFAIPAWMAANSATAAEIGFVIGMASIPWSLKFINGALMDRYAFLPMGRRRAWLIGAQTVIVASLLICALLGPGPRDEVILGGIAFVVSLAVVFQDVAADALAVDIADEGERGYTGGLMAGGQSLGIAIAAALAGTIIYLFGVGAAYIACAALIAVVTAYLVWVRERTGERRLPWSPGKSHAASLAIQADNWFVLIKDAFRNLWQKDSIIWSGALFLRGMGYGTMVIATPLIAANYAGWNEAQIGTANGTAQLLAAICAMTVGGYLCTKLGAKRFQIMSFAAFVAAVIGFVLMEEFWHLSAMVWAIIVGWSVLYVIVGTPMSAIVMAFCDPKTGATQFSIYMAFVNQGTSFAGFTFAILAGAGGVQLTLIALAAAFSVALCLTWLISLPTRKAVDELPIEVSAVG